MSTEEYFKADPNSSDSTSALDQKPVDHFFSTLSAGHELFQILPLRYMVSMAGPDSKHWASEICAVPVIGFQAYTDNNNGKSVAYKAFFFKCMINN